MNCFNHPIENAVASCQDCQKGLCTKCATNFSLPICTSCNSKRKKTQKRTIYKEFFVMLVLGFLFCFFLLYMNSPIHNLTLKQPSTPKAFLIFQGFYTGAALVAGWKTLNRITPSFFLFLPLIGWVVYFAVKFLLSGFLGVFMLPIRLFKNIRQLYLFKK